MTDETIDCNVKVLVEPALNEIEKTNLKAFELNGDKIEFIEHRNKKTELNVTLKSKCSEVKNRIDDLVSYFLGRFELVSDRSFSYELVNIINAKTGENISGCKNITVYGLIDSTLEPRIISIDNFVKSFENEIVIKSIAFFHHGQIALNRQHAFLSMTNAFHTLIQDIGKQNRTVLSGLNASWILLHNKIIEDESKREFWEKELRWIHDTIDDIRYKNKQVEKEDVERIRKSYKQFLDMYIKYKSIKK